MKNKIMFVFVILFILFCIILGVKYGMEIQYRNELTAIQASRNISLDLYNNNKKLTESYLQVYEIIDENSYQSIKNDMYNRFSMEMQDEIFPTVNYSGLALHSMTTYINKIIGTNNSSGVNTFLIEYNLKGINYDQNITNLVDISDGVIINVTRIK